MKKLMNYIGIIMFFAFTAMIGISTLFFQQKTGLKETYSETKSISETIKQYASDNFPLKNNWLSLYAKTARIMGQRDFDGIYLDTENDRLIELFTEYDESRLAANISEINTFQSKYSRSSLYIMLVPTASGIYRTDLPESAGTVNEQKLIDDIYYNVTADVTTLDAYNPLYSARDNYIYCRTDPYWTQLGAYEVYSTSAARMGLTAYTVSNYDIDYTQISYYGSLSTESNITNVTPDTINAYRCKNGSYVKSTILMRDRQTYTKSSVYNSSGLKSDNKYSYFLGSNNFKCAQIETTNTDMPSLLIIKSDYANCYVPFLAPHYSRITLVDPEMLSDGESLTDIANPNDYDQVLFLYDVKSFCEAENLDKIN